MFCNTLGFEGSIAHRAFRHMSDELAARGSWTLRFDYDGEGDSAGGPWEPGRVAAWMESIDAAVAVLRDAASLMYDSSVSGWARRWRTATRQRTRECRASCYGRPAFAARATCANSRALSRLSSVARPMQRVNAEPYPDDALEVVGFQLAGETLRDLAEIDLVAAEGSFVPPAVLLIERDDAPESSDFLHKLTESGSQVDHLRMSGYEDFATDGEETSVLPWPTLHGIEDWLEQARRPTCCRSRTAPRRRSTSARACQSTRHAVASWRNRFGSTTGFPRSAHGPRPTHPTAGCASCSPTPGRLRASGPDDCT